MPGTAVRLDQHSLLFGTVFRIDHRQLPVDVLHAVESEHHGGMLYSGNRHAEVLMVNPVGNAEQVRGHSRVTMDEFAQLLEGIILAVQRIQIGHRPAQHRQPAIFEMTPNPDFYSSVHLFVRYPSEKPRAFDNLGKCSGW